MNLVFSLHALAAWKMLHQSKIRCCRAAGEPAIRAECSRDQRSNSQTADKKPTFKVFHLMAASPMLPVQRNATVAEISYSLQVRVL